MRPSSRRIGEDGVPVAGEALVQLEDRAPQARTHPTQLGQGPFDVLRRSQVLHAQGTGHPGLAEYLPASRLGSQARETRVDAIERYAEEDRQLSLERRRVVDRQVGAGEVGNAGSDPLDQPRALQDLLRERDRGGVVGAKQRQPRPRVARRDAREELEVVLEEERVDGLRGHVYEMSPRVAEADQEEEQPLLVERGPRQLAELALIKGQGRHYDGCVVLFVPGEDRAPELGEARLEGVESRDLRFKVEIAGERRLGNHATSTGDMLALPFPQATARNLHPISAEAFQ